ncbi:HTH-type transcriptional regulator immR [Listeria newyorkensis]|nr:HTH-type transcriptional regulator immR [Listeria newyorkensis]
MYILLVEITVVHCYNKSIGRGEGMDFGEKLISLRKKHQLTQKQLAEKIGVTSSTISKYENDNHRPPIFILAKLADELGTTTDFLLDDVAGLREKNSVNAFPLIGNPELEKWYLELPYSYSEEELLLLKRISEALGNRNI